MKRACVCGKGPSLADCCGPLLDGVTKARTAEQLMRSRYSAYVLSNEAHILRTWHPDFRPATVDLLDQPEWLGLVVLAAEGGGPLDETGIVEFRAAYVGGVREELSRFGRWQGDWVYLDAEE